MPERDRETPSGEDVDLTKDDLAARRSCSERSRRSWLGPRVPELRSAVGHSSPWVGLRARTSRRSLGETAASASRARESMSTTSRTRSAATHEVLNQPPPLVDYNAFEADPALGEALI